MELSIKRKILIIDREPDIRRSVGSILNRKGFQHKDAVDYEDAMDLIKSEDFDLIIMEIRIFKTNGFRFLKEVKKLCDPIEVIILTGFVSIENAVRTLRHHGAFDFLAKPLDSEDQLINSVEKALYQ
jgi:two-component system, sporulation sensor kinase A